jgi:hypothetical protein
VHTAAGHTDDQGTMDELDRIRRGDEEALATLFAGDS